MEYNDYHEKEIQDGDVEETSFPTCTECSEEIPVWEFKSYYGKCQYCAEEKLNHFKYLVDEETEEA